MQYTVHQDGGTGKCESCGTPCPCEVVSDTVYFADIEPT